MNQNTDPPVVITPAFWRVEISVLYAAIAFLLNPLPARADDAAICGVAIAQTEHSARLPPGLLHAIGMVESARLDLKTGHWAPWPWSINVAGIDHVYASKQAAIAAVEAAQASGIQSIDVGCMQINLKHHPLAFATLEDAFNPNLNVTYAAAFLWRLHDENGQWPIAAGAYHSQTPELATAYVARLAAYWPPAAGYAAPHLVAMARDVDPYNVMTPEFKAKMVQAAIARAARDTALQPPPLVKTVNAAPPRQVPLKFADASAAP